MEGVGAGLATVQMRRRYPFRFAVGVFSGGPALFEEPMVGSASEGELVDIGAVGPGPIFDVVDLAVIAGHIAAGVRTPTLLGMQDNSLTERSQALGVIQRQRLALVKD